MGSLGQMASESQISSLATSEVDQLGSSAMGCPDFNASQSFGSSRAPVYEVPNFEFLHPSIMRKRKGAEAGKKKAEGQGHDATGTDDNLMNVSRRNLANDKTVGKCENEGKTGTIGKKRQLIWRGNVVEEDDASTNPLNLSSSVGPAPVINHQLNRPPMRRLLFREAQVDEIVAFEDGPQPKPKKMKIATVELTPLPVLVPSPDLNKDDVQSGAQGKLSGPKRGNSQSGQMEEEPQLEQAQAKPNFPRNFEGMLKMLEDQIGAAVSSFDFISQMVPASHRDQWMRNFNMNDVRKALTRAEDLIRKQKVLYEEKNKQ